MRHAAAQLYAARQQARQHRSNLVKPDLPHRTHRLLVSASAGPVDVRPLALNLSRLADVDAAATTFLARNQHQDR